MAERTHASDRAALAAISPHAAGRARKDLVAWGSYLCLHRYPNVGTQREIIGAMRPALRDLRTSVDGPIYQVRMAAESLVEAVDAGRPITERCRQPLALALQAYFLSNIENAA